MFTLSASVGTVVISSIAAAYGIVALVAAIRSHKVMAVVCASYGVASLAVANLSFDDALMVSFVGFIAMILLSAAFAAFPPDAPHWYASMGARVAFIALTAALHVFPYIASNSGPHLYHANVVAGQLTAEVETVDEFGAVIGNVAEVADFKASAVVYQDGRIEMSFVNPSEFMPRPVCRAVYLDSTEVDTCYRDDKIKDLELESAARGTYPISTEVTIEPTDEFTDNIRAALEVLRSR